jgi:hypothetical protein
MAYTIYNNDGTVLSTIAVGEVDTYSTSLDLIGKNVNNYGEYYNNNLVRLLTSFASPETEEPRTPQTGQLWFNKTTKRLTVYDGSSFQPTYGSHVSGTAPITTSTGDFWYDSVNSQLKVWDGDSYNLVGPATSGLLGTFGVLPATIPIRDDTSKIAQKVGVINSYGSYIGLISTSSFTMEASSSTVYFGVNATQPISEGITIFKNLSVVGNITINGWNVKNHPNTDLTAYYDITSSGSYTSTNTTTNLTNYNKANVAITAVLAKMFSTSTYMLGSQVSVICVDPYQTSVRKFELQLLYPSFVWWEPLNIYAYTSATSTWLWATSTNINIVI